MKRDLIGILTCVAILVAVSSCATEPLAPGQLRLLRASIPGPGVVYLGTRSEVNITFVADGRPTMRRVCFSYPLLREGPYCSAINPKDVEFGSPGSIKAIIPAPSRSGPSRSECYVEYWQDTKTLRTNVLNFSVVVH